MPPADTPLLSIVAPVWNELEHTTRFVASVRRHTDVPYELILVDNGSDAPVAAFLDQAADVVVRNEANLGFAKAMNQGLARASGRVVAFCNNDIEVPERWASRLVEHLNDEQVGIVVPAVTKALLSRTVRTEPGVDVETLDPFESPPAAVVYVMATATARELGGFSEEYEIASGEDADLVFTVWVNALDVLYDSRVLVWHHSKGTAHKLEDWQTLWKTNRERFLDKWTSDAEVPRVDRCPPATHAYRRAVARSVAGWMHAYFQTREKLRAERSAIARKPTARLATAIRRRVRRAA